MKSDWSTFFLVFAALVAVGSGALVGGFREVNVNDEGVQNALKFAVVRHNRGTNDMYLRQVAEVVKAQSQVVAGVRYIITVNMVQSSCRKNSAVEACEAAANVKPYQCTFMVWSRPWLGEIHVMDEKCQNPIQ